MDFVDVIESTGEDKTRNVDLDQSVNRVLACH